MYMHIKFLKKTFETKINYLKIENWSLFVNWEDPNYF